MTRTNTSWTPFNSQKSKLTLAKQHLLKLGRHICLKLSTNLGNTSWGKNAQMKYNMTLINAWKNALVNYFPQNE